jgi:hypothetical protein
MEFPSEQKQISSKQAKRKEDTVVQHAQGTKPTKE